VGWGLLLAGGRVVTLLRSQATSPQPQRQQQQQQQQRQQEQRPHPVLCPLLLLLPPPRVVASLPAQPHCCHLHLLATPPHPLLPSSERLPQQQQRQQVSGPLQHLMLHRRPLLALPPQALTGAAQQALHQTPLLLLAPQRP
jgi:hypothetical protein